MAKPKDIVIFRRWKSHPMSVIALFPEIPANPDASMCMSYEHVGQHGGAHCGEVINVTRPADIENHDVLSLFGELTKIGYNLKIMFKETSKMRDVRRAAAQAVVSGARVK
jgi:hypothetical protein